MSVLDRVDPLRLLTSLWGAPAAVLALATMTLACGAPAPVSPRPSAERFAKATLKSDAEAIHRMLTAKGRDQYSIEDVRALLRDGRAELGATAQSVLKDKSQCQWGRARLVLAGDSELVLEEGARGYRITRAFGVGGESQTPTAMLSELGRALDSLDLPQILSLLGSETREELQVKLRRLAEELARAGEARIEPTVSGYVATLPGGTRIELVLEPEGYRVSRIQ
jgi:transposase